jgi:hypothetical protein
MDVNDDDFGLDKNSELYKLLKLLRDGTANDEDVDNMDHLNALAANTDLLGEPDDIQVYNEDGLKITVKKWFVLDGEVKNIDIEGDYASVSQAELQNKIDKIIQSQGEDVKVVSLDITDNIVKETMESLLEKALKVEDYELAAKIRDDIKERDELIETTKKEIDELIDNGFYDDAKLLVDNIRELKETGLSYD